MAYRDWSNITKFIIMVFCSAVVFMVSALIDEREILFSASMTAPDFSEDKAEIKETINQFNRLIMDFYTRGGNPQGIDYFPANIITKRETFKDLIYLDSNQLVMVYDLTATRFERLDVFSSMSAGVTTVETWVWVIRKRSESVTKPPMAMKVRVDYDLSKEKGKWVVLSHKIMGLVND